MKETVAGVMGGAEEATTDTANSAAEAVRLLWTALCSQEGMG